MSPETEEVILETLAEIKVHVVSMDGKIGSMDGKIEAMDGKIGSMDGRLSSVEAGLKGVEGKLGKVESRLGRVESRLDGVESRLDGVESRLDRVDVRLDHLEDDVFSIKEQLPQFATKDELRALEGRMMTELEQQTVILKRLDEERFAMVHRQDRLEGRVGKLEAQNAKL